MQLNNFITIVFLSLLFISVIIKIFLDIINFNHREKNKNNIPDELKEFIDKDKLLLINKYSNEKLFFSLIEYFFDKVLLLIILFLSLIPLYYNFLMHLYNNIYLLGILFFGGFYIIQFIFDIPFSIYYNFIIEKKYQFNKMNIKIWFLDLFKKLLITIILGIIIIFSLLFFIYNFEKIWWILLWLFFFLFSLFIQIIYPVFIAPLFNKFKPLSNENLKNKIKILLNNSGFKSKGIFEMDASKRSSHSNAYFTGFGKTKRIVLFDSLLEKHTEEEILAILAHELGHYKYKHVLINTIITFIISFIGLFIAYLLINNRMIYSAFGFADNFNIEESKYVGLLLLSILTSPIGFFFTPFSSIISRKFEYQADKYSVKILNDNKSLISALIKLNLDNLSNIYPADIYSWFYYSHPPLFKRIKALKCMEKI